MFKFTKQTVVQCVILVLMLFFANLVNESRRKEFHEFIASDVYFEFYQAQEIGSGENPYKRILSGDLLNNNKYATLMPLYYYTLYFFAYLGEFKLEGFLDVFRDALFLSEVVISVYMYLAFKKRDNGWLGLLAVLLFLFNRWTLRGVRDVKQDFLALAFLIPSLFYLDTPNKKHNRIAYLLYGISLGIKHVGIFLLPVYFIKFFNLKSLKTLFNFKKLDYKELLLSVLLVSIPTIGVAIPIMLDNFNSLFYSMLISLTRAPVSNGVEFGFAETLIFYDIGVKNNSIFFYLLPRLPFVLALLSSFVLYVSGKMTSYLYIASCMFIFVAFNPVLINHYFVWIGCVFMLPFLGSMYFEKNLRK